MERFTISLDPALAQQFDAVIAERGYGNRSEAVRDLLREKLGAVQLAAGHAKWCAATLTYVYDRTEHAVVEQVLHWQHDHHDLVVTSQNTPLDHQHCLETVILRGKTESVRACASQLIAARGVRHGSMHLIPLHRAHPHSHGDLVSAPHHHHLEPVS